MPRIPDEWFDAVVYLYPTRDDAEESRPVGATGFVVSVGAVEILGRKVGFRYVVTNAHVVTGGATFARFNRGGGGFEIIEVDSDDWRFHADADDIAVAPILRHPDLSVTSVPIGILLSSDDVQRWNIGAGDECFFIGRFGGHEGRRENRPTARFGNVATMQADPVPQDLRGIAQESFLVEARSLSGYSGSPVFVYSDARFETTDDGALAVVPLIEGRLFLLGVDWGHRHFDEPVRDADGATVESWRVRSNSGLMMVVPAWKLHELLMSAEFVAEREATIARWQVELEAEHSPPDG